MQVKIKLSDREKQVIKLVTKGLKNVEIGKELKISIRTVETHLSRIYTKLNAKNRVHAVAIFLRYF